MIPKPIEVNDLLTRLVILKLLFNNIDERIIVVVNAIEDEIIE